ncbi:MAG: ABC transporter ATP-binding protein [Anaerolineae bacterium]|nr:ABC transporter ATP-binding protein [Caldilineales bacterium]MDW8268166.1 ABC transporter ATP-binding protein [Anaerolineae bacterium]
MSRIAIEVENLGKRYRIGLLQEEEQDTLGGALLSWLKAPLTNFRRLQRLSKFDNGDEADVIWALRDVSFQVEEGEAVGIIGRNGAGKSTLLKILTRITPPTTGRAVLDGRVASLLEVGTGFHPDLTGRENVYLNGTVLGMTAKEIDRKFDEIVEFSGVARFIDTPVKRYSSGMRVRLAFAVAAHLDPEILLIDEVLAVGDAQFQRKCLGKMSEIAGEGRTVLFVSHNLPSVEALCARAFVLDEGRLVFSGPSREAVSFYLDRQVFGLASGVDLRHHPHRLPGDREPIFESLRLLNGDGVETSSFAIGEPITFELKMNLGEEVLDTPFITIAIEKRGIPICALTTRFMVARPFLLTGLATARCTWRPGWLTPGEYTISRVTLKAGASAERLDHIDEVLAFEIVERDVYGTGKIARRDTILVPDGTWHFF